MRTDLGINPFEAGMRHLINTYIRGIPQHPSPVFCKAAIKDLRKFSEKMGVIP
jgi:hypothetical protein